MRQFSHGRRTGVVCAAVLLLLFSGCAGGISKAVSWVDSSVDLVWPEPPDKPRIRYLRTLAGPTDFADEGRSGKLFRWLTGEKEQGLSFSTPYGIVADGEGRVWVADSGSRAVHAFDLKRGRVDYLTAAGGEAFISPVGVALDRAGGRLYISDSVLNKVFVVDYRGNLLGIRQAPGGFGRPAGLATDAEGSLYAVDVLKGTIEVFARGGSHLQSIKSAAPGAGFNRPVSVFVDRSGRIYVTDSMNFRIEVLGRDGEHLGLVGQIGDVPGTFARPRGVAVDSDGHIYVADAAFDNIQIFDAAGRLLLYFGGLGKEPGQFSLPAGLFIDQFDRLYVVDPFNRRVQIFQYLPQGEG